MYLKIQYYLFFSYKEFYCQRQSNTTTEQNERIKTQNFTVVDGAWFKRTGNFLSISLFLVIFFRYSAWIWKKYCHESSQDISSGSLEINKTRMKHIIAEAIISFDNHQPYCLSPCNMSWWFHFFLQETIEKWTNLFQSGIFKCPVQNCGKGFRTHMSLLKHIKQCDAKDPAIRVIRKRVTLPCHVCQERFPIFPDFTNHARVYHSNVS